jgi:hypothetical protein
MTETGPDGGDEGEPIANPLFDGGVDAPARVRRRRCRCWGWGGWTLPWRACWWC